MTSSTSRADRIEPLPGDPDDSDLLALLLYSASHDLRAPLLTLSLSGELLTTAEPDSDRAAVALDGLRHGVRDLERMLDALMSVSRAQRRPLQIEPVALHALLTGHVVLTEHEAGRDVVRVDRRAVAGVLEQVTGNAPCSIRATQVDRMISLEIATPLVDDFHAATPLAALLRSLHVCGGTPIAALAAWQVMLERCGGALTIGDGRVTIALPLAA